MLLDYFFWGYLKNKVYITKPNNVDDLRGQIIDETKYIPREYNKKAVKFLQSISSFSGHSEGAF